MLKPHPMTKVIIAGSKDHLEWTVDHLFSTRAVHIKETIAEDEIFSMGEPLREASPASEKLLKIRNATKVLEMEEVDDSVFRERGRRIHEKRIGERLDFLIKQIDEAIMDRWEKRSSLEGDIRDLDRQMEEIEPFEGLPLRLEDMEPYENLAVMVGTVREDPSKAISAITSRFSIFSTKTKAGLLVAVFVVKEKKDEVNKALLERDFSELRPPPGKGSITDRMADLEGRKASIKRKISYLDKELEKLRAKNAHLLLASEEQLMITVEKAEAPMRFATSTNSFVIEGFLPEHRYEDFKEELDSRTRGSLHVEAEEPEKDESIPVALDNPKPARPYQVLTDLIDRPKYKEVDPTILMFIGLPLMFGMMLGDVGYATVMIVLAITGSFTKLFSKLEMKGAASQLNFVLLTCGISSLIFGLLYNEIFGYEMFTHSHVHHDTVVLFPFIHFPEFTIPRVFLWGPTHFPFIRLEEVSSLLKTCIWIGFIHIFLGLVIGFRNEYVKHGWKAAVGEKGSWMLIMLGGLMVLYIMLSGTSGYVLPPNAEMITWVGTVLLITGCVILVWGEGVTGLVHIPSLISNTMSYLRIFAISLSSAGLAIAFNEMGLKLFDGGGVNILMGGLILMAGHSINFILGIIGPGLHSLRLHYVEFFIRFYEGGGVRYSPFGMARRFTRSET